MKLTTIKIMTMIISNIVFASVLAGFFSFIIMVIENVHHKYKYKKGKPIDKSTYIITLVILSTVIVILSGAIYYLLHITTELLTLIP